MTPIFYYRNEQEEILLLPCADRGSQTVDRCRMNQLPPERTLRDKCVTTAKWTCRHHCFCSLLVSLRSNLSRAEKMLQWYALYAKKRFKSKPRVQTRPAHSFLADIKQCFGSNLVVDEDSRICSTCRAAISKHRKTGETFEHVSTHIY